MRRWTDFRVRLFVCSKFCCPVFHRWKSPWFKEKLSSIFHTRFLLLKFSLLLCILLTSTQRLCLFHDMENIYWQVRVKFWNEAKRMKCAHASRLSGLQQRSKITLYKKVPFKIHNNSSYVSQAGSLLLSPARSQITITTELQAAILIFSSLRQTENNMHLVTNVYTYKQLSSSNSAQHGIHICQI